MTTRHTGRSLRLGRIELYTQRTTGEYMRRNNRRTFFKARRNFLHVEISRCVIGVHA